MTAYIYPINPNDCHTRALCNATGEDYETLRRLSGPFLRRTGRMAWDDTQQIANLLGYQIEEIPCPSKAKTLISAPRAALPKGRYLVHVRGGHIVCMRDGLILDWAANRRFRVMGIFTIKKVAA